jgi:hypothetical protein
MTLVLALSRDRGGPHTYVAHGCASPSRTDTSG